MWTTDILLLRITDVKLRVGHVGRCYRLGLPLDIWIDVVSLSMCTGVCRWKCGLIRVGCNKRLLFFTVKYDFHFSYYTYISPVFRGFLFLNKIPVIVQQF